MKRLFHRRSAPNIKTASSDKDPPPPLPSLAGGAQNDLTTTQKEMRRGMTLPALFASPSSFSKEKLPPLIIEQQPTPVQAQYDPHIQSATLAATVTMTAESMETKIWKNVNSGGGGGTKAEKILNKIEDQAGESLKTAPGQITYASLVRSGRFVDECTFHGR